MIPAWLLHHLWQSTAVAGVVWLLTLALQRHAARTRYWLWLAASLKFLAPFSLLSTLGGWLGTSLLPAQAQPRVFFFMEQVTRRVLPPAAPAAGRPQWDLILAATWITGSLVVLGIFFVQWLRVAQLARQGQRIRKGRALDTLQRLQPAAEIPLLATAPTCEPGVFGIFRPVMLLPEGIVDRLNDAQLEAVMAHELAHIERRDNLASLLHMLIEAVFWFHPLVWWLGARMLAEREQACDEQVLQRGGEPQAYAEAILQVCAFCLEAPLACVSGVTGADLKRRIEDILARRVGVDLNTPRKLLLGLTALAALAGPLCFGILTAPSGRAGTPEQEDSSRRFDFVKIKTHAGAPGQRTSLAITPDGRLTAQNFSLKRLLAFAYDIAEFQVEGDTGAARFDIAAHAHAASFRDPAVRAMMRRLLDDHLHVRVHTEVRNLPAYDLTVAPGGARLTPAAGEPRTNMSVNPGKFTARAIPVSELAKQLSVLSGRLVVDRTGLSGDYNFQFSWNPASTIASSLEPQLGLELRESMKPVTILVVDHQDVSKIEHN